MYGTAIDIQPTAGQLGKHPVGDHSPQERERLEAENAILIGRLERLTAKLQQLSRDNRQLRDALAQAKHEIAHLRAMAQARPAPPDRTALVRAMLRDRACRNP